MRFTASTIALVASLMAGASAAALPAELSLRAQVCGAAPSASGSQTPLSQPTAATADACEKQAKAQSSCQSFAFGLPPSASAPLCKLFSVPAAQVPPQETNIVVFDIACTDIPTGTPTTADPTGANNANNANNANTGANGSNNNNGNAGSGSQTSQQQQGGQTGQQSGPKQQKREVCGAAPTGPSTNAPTPLSQPTAGSADACLALGKQTSGCQS